MKMRIVAWSVSAALMACALPLLAHHAFSAEFDAESPVVLTGKVVRVRWINPHAWMHLEVKTEEGVTENWMIEAGPPGAFVVDCPCHPVCQAVARTPFRAGFFPGCGLPMLARPGWCRCEL